MRLNKLFPFGAYDNLNNFNLALSTGVYRIAAASMANAPLSGGIYGTLLTIVGGAYISQMFTSIGGDIYSRTRDSENWTEWKQL